MPPRLSFDEFLTTAPGRLLVEWESREFGSLVEDVFGSHALQIGSPALHTLQANRIHSKWLIARPDPKRASTARPFSIPLIEADLEALPVAGESIDLVTMPHALDFSREPQQVLREAVRILEPEGRLVLTAFNSHGLWWMRQRAVAFGLPPYLPSNLMPISLSRLKDWFSLLGLKIDRGRFGIYAPSFRREKSLEAWKWLDKAGDRWAPQFSNLIMLSAVKRVPGGQIINFAAAARTAKKVPAEALPAANLNKKEAPFK